MRATLLILNLFILFSCVNNQNSNEKKNLKSENEYPQDTIFKGFLSLKWHSSKEEAIKYFSEGKTSLSIDKVYLAN
jgi:hypothetical protein